MIGKEDLAFVKSKKSEFSGPHFRLPRFDYRIATVTTDRCYPLPALHS